MQIQLIPRLKLHYLSHLLFFPMWQRFISLFMNTIASRTKQDAHAKSDFYSFVTSSLDSSDSGIQPSEFLIEAMFFLIAGTSTPRASGESAANIFAT
jgi:cytochrome P450